MNKTPTLQLDDSFASPVKHLKIVLIGDASVGKSTLAKQWANLAVSEAYQPTIGLDVYQAQVSLPGQFYFLFIHG